MGCWKVPHAFFDEMRGAGIEARSFLKVRFPLFTSKVNYRNHRKIVVIDGRVAEFHFRQHKARSSKNQIS